MSLYKHIAQANPDGCYMVLHKYGYANSDLNSIDDVAYVCQTMVACEGENAFKDLLKLHPDRDVIIEDFKEKLGEAFIPIASDIADWLAGDEAQKAMDDFAKAVKDAFAYLTSPEGKADIQAFIDKFMTLIDSVMKVAEIVQKLLDNGAEVPDQLKAAEERKKSGESKGLLYQAWDWLTGAKPTSPKTISLLFNALFFNEETIDNSTAKSTAGSLIFTPPTETVSPTRKGASESNLSLTPGLGTMLKGWFSQSLLDVSTV
jgi:hypothetical protein